MSKNFFKYLPRHLAESYLSVLCALALIIIINAVLLTSSSLARSLNDIIYLNILLVVISCGFGAISHMRFCSRYSKLRQALDIRDANAGNLLPEAGSFFPRLLRDIAGFKDDECLEKTGVLEESLDELNDYIIQWVHEIKIPISVCELIAEKLASEISEASEETDEAAAEGGAEDGHQNIRNLKLELERTRFLISQVLYAGRASRYEKDLSICEFNLQKAVREAVKRNSTLFIHKDIEVDLGPLDYNIVNDEKWVGYILDQILNNAGKYTGDSGRVEIRASEDAKAVRLHIRDNGIGIAEHDMERIFDKGFTGDNGRRMTKSTGMGLYYSKVMADKLGIGIEAESRAGAFTEFTLVFYKISDFLKIAKVTNLSQ